MHPFVFFLWEGMPSALAEALSAKALSAEALSVEAL